MLKQEITEKISQFFKVTEFEAEKIFDDIFSKIIEGVKEDNIVDVVNFGEFIVKYNNGKNGGSNSPYKKTIEFLASVNLEDEIGHKSYDIYKSPVTQTIPPIADTITAKTDSTDTHQSLQDIQPEKVDADKSSEKEFHEVVAAGETKFSSELENSEKQSEDKGTFSTGQESYTGSTVSPEITHENTGPVNIEEEFKKKREALLNKISIHPLQDLSQGQTQPDDKSSESKEFKYFIKDETKENEPPVLPEEIKHDTTQQVKPETETGQITEIPKDTKITQGEVIQGTPENETIHTETKSSGDINKNAIPDSVQETAKSYYDEDLSNKSFADYFTEINKDEHITPVSAVKDEEKPPEAIPPLPQIIPPKAVELHKEITGTEEVSAKPVVPEVTAAPVAQDSGEHVSGDKSYYIWYKDSEPNVSDTQTMSYEYELLYQATKEAEYKSKLKIYVTTFILFFSVVLALLIFSPVIYKMFFTPVEQQSFQNVDDQQSSDQVGEHKAQLNVSPVLNNQNNPADTSNKTQTGQNQTSQQTQSTETQQNQQQTGTQQNQTEQNQSTQQNSTQNQQQNTEPSIEGVTKTTMGWIDDKYKVAYIKLDNGKYTIQESSWSSDDKARQRISKIEALNISGIKGSIAKTDLGDKGVWYRTRFGEFGSIEEARKKAEELRSKI